MGSDPLHSLPASPVPAGTNELLTADNKERCCCAAFPAGDPRGAEPDRQELPEEDKSESWHLPVTEREAVMEISLAGRYHIPFCCQSPASQSTTCTHWEVRTAHSIHQSAATGGLMVPE